MSWKSVLNDYFNFSRTERFGVLGLCGCILLVLAIKGFLPLRMKHKILDIAAFDEEIAQFRRVADSAHFATHPSEIPEYFPPTQVFFDFDPNRANDDQLGKLGLNERQIRNIRNYLAKGGQFRQKEDLKKLYTIPATQYQVLEPYIRITRHEPDIKRMATEINEIADTKAATKSTETLSSGKKDLQVELNLADSSLLTQLSGIGPVLASRTIRYRNRIGGFANVTQLGEVYGINPELMEQLSPHLSVDSTLIRKIPVNTATFKDLVTHPYLNEMQVRGILKYRQLQTHINNMDELVLNHILDRKEARRIEPYLTFE